MMCTATTSDGSDERVELCMTGSGFTWFYKNPVKVYQISSIYLASIYLD